MALNQGKVISDLEKLVNPVDPSQFILGVLSAFGFPSATIKKLQMPGDPRNIGVGGDVGVKKKIYFRSSKAASPEALDELAASNVITKNDVRFVILTDYKRFLAKDLIAEDSLDIEPADLPRNYSFFLPLAGYEKAVIHAEHPADLKASEKMGQLFDLIRERNPADTKEKIHALNVFLTRLLFCFYAEDTDIFSQAQLTNTIKSVTREDGSDLQDFFTQVFQVLNLAENDKARKQYASHFTSFPYVNGGLFQKDEPVPEFGPKSRRILIECGSLNWSDINPDIFGSMFQAVIDPEQRGNLGQHYTSVPNIMKVIEPLFLDDLYEELEASRSNKTKLQALLARLQKIRIFDPACGSGNFLIISYKELRKFEMEVFKALNAISGQNVFFMSGIQLSQFYGIEIDDFAHEIAILSLWLAEHQMNKVFAGMFGHAEPMLPLKAAGNIICANSLQIPWDRVCRSDDDAETYIIGNPPFLGSAGRSGSQNEDMERVFNGVGRYKTLDYVASWFFVASEYSFRCKVEFAFVTTNSICQGDQVSVLWPRIFQRDFQIKFAYQTFAWKSNAKGGAAVHVVVIGLAKNPGKRRLYKMDGDRLFAQDVSSISPYLTEGSKTCVRPVAKPLLNNASRMTKGSQPTDGGAFFLTHEEKTRLVQEHPECQSWIRNILGAEEFLNGGERYCLWLLNIDLEHPMKIAEIARRINHVKAVRENSKKLQTRSFANTPAIFTEIRQPTSGSYLLIPRVSSERRKYIPIGFMSHEVICSDANQMVPNATLYDFALLTSEMHNDWMRCVAGRLKSDYRYSATLVYNTFPWPTVTDKQKAEIESLAEQVLLTREDYPDKTLAQLYDPDTMPAPLKDAHEQLDRAVDSLYRKKPFKDASERLEHLFTMYEKLVAQAGDDNTTMGDEDD